MKPAPKISEERHRRMFPPDCEHGPTYGEVRQLTLFDTDVLHTHHHRAATRRARDHAAEGTFDEFFAALGESADQYTQVWKRALERATTALFGTLIVQPPQRSIVGIIDGRSVSFGSTEEKFDALVAEWRRLREPGSSTEPLVNDAYGQIVAMGWDAVPFLLREVQRQSGHWFSALTWITGVDLIPPTMHGNMREMRKVWVRWGTENGYFQGNSQGRMVPSQSSEHQRERLQLHE